MCTLGWSVKTTSPGMVQDKAGKIVGLLVGVVLLFGFIGIGSGAKVLNPGGLIKDAWVHWWIKNLGEPHRILHCLLFKFKLTMCGLNRIFSFPHSERLQKDGGLQRISSPDPELPVRRGGSGFPAKQPAVVPGAHCGTFAWSSVAQDALGEHLWWFNGA